MQLAFLHRVLRRKDRGAESQNVKTKTFHKLAEVCSSNPMHIVLLLLSMEIFLILTGDSQSLNKRSLTSIASECYYYVVVLSQ